MKTRDKQIRRLRAAARAYLAEYMKGNRKRVSEFQEDKFAGFDADLEEITWLVGEFWNRYDIPTVLEALVEGDLVEARAWLGEFQSTR